MPFSRFILSFGLLVAGFAAAQQAPSNFIFDLPELRPGATVAGSLDTGDGQNFKDGARVDQVKLYLDAGDVVELTLSSEVFDTFLSVYDPAGQLIAVNDDAEDFTQSRSVIEADMTGRYMVVVSGFSDFDLGDYQLSALPLTVQDGGALKPGQAVSGLLNDDDEQLSYRYLDSYTFTLKKPMTVEVSMSSTVMDSYLILLSADGATVLAENDDDEYGYSLDARLSADLPAGEYIIWATTNGEGTEGFYKLSLDELR